jgi:hypothetical protein
MNAQELAHRLEIVTGRRYQRAGSGYLGPCVAHDDRNPSMTIFDGHTAAQVRCKAGCEQSAVIDALKRLGVWDCRQAAPPVRLSIPKPPQDDTAAGRMKAKWLWSKRQPLIRSLAETYLRKHRGITCMPPPTLEFLPADSTYPPAMIAALGFAQ